MAHVITRACGSDGGCIIERSVDCLVSDHRCGLLSSVNAEATGFAELPRGRCAELFDKQQWQAIDAAERARGRRAGHPRIEFTTAETTSRASEVHV